jgi:hypothetical protein
MLSTDYVPGIQLGTILERNPEIGRRCRLDSFETVRRDSNDGKWNPLDVNGLAQDVGIAREASCPVVIAQNDNGRVMFFIFKSETTAAFLDS